ncbi:eCIS core domain-containing protein [Sorangium sp. So ce341]|uniref:eCIS core domain-containing protein n=1 Tax=Sorangium sp. So ce341 TaxID=3133302 RepID=UPI003F6154F1
MTLTHLQRAERAPPQAAPAPLQEHAPAPAQLAPVVGGGHVARAVQRSLGAAFRLPSGPTLPVSAADQVGQAALLRASWPLGSGKADVAPDALGEAERSPAVQTAPLGAPALGLQMACGPTCACDSCAAKKALADDKDAVAVQRADDDHGGPGAHEPDGTSVPTAEAGAGHDAEGSSRAEAAAENEGANEAEGAREAAPPARPTPEQALARLGAGSPLPSSIAARYSPAFGRDLSGVEVHTDSPLAASMGARAFTVGHHVAFAPGEYRPDTTDGDTLLAHELAHVVQQSGGSGEMQGSGLDYDGYEAEADRAASVAVRGGVVPRLTPVRRGLVQRGAGDWLKRKAGAAWRGVKRGGRAVGGAVKRGAEVVGEAIEDVGEAGWEALKAAFWRLVRAVAPSAEPYLKNPGKLWDDLKQAVLSGIDALFGGLFDAVSKGGIFGAAHTFVASFLPAIAKVQKAVAKDDHAGIVAGVRQAIDAFAGMTDAMFGPAKAVLGAIAGGIKKAISVVGKPIFDLAKKVAKGAWDTLSGFVDGVVKIARKIGRKLGPVWRSIKSGLGFGGGEGSDDSKDGLWARIKKWAGDLWDKAKAPVTAVLGPLKTVATVLLVPFSPMILAFKYGPKVVHWLKELYNAVKDPKNIPRARAKVAQVLRGLTAFLRGAAAKLAGLAEDVNGRLDDISKPLGELGRALGASTILKVLAAGAKLLADAIDGAVKWVQKHVPPFIQGASDFFAQVWTWAQPILDVVAKVIFLVSNPLLGIPMLVASWVWRKIPAWLKVIIITFVLEVLIRFVKALPDGALMAGAGGFGPLLKHAVLGFLKGIYGEQGANIDKAVAAADRIARLMGGGTIAFLGGLGVGILSGIWDGIVGPIELVVLLIEGVAKLAEWLDRAASSLPADIQALFGRIKKSANAIKNNAWPAIKSVFTGEGGGLKKAFAVLQGAWDAVMGGAESVGGAVAGALMKFLMLSDYELGKKLGWVAGMVLFEVALAVLTGGASAALAAAKGPLLRIVKMVVKMHEYMGKVFQEILHMLGPVQRALEKGLHAIAESPAVKPIVQALKSLFKDLEAATAKALGKFADDAATKGAAVAGREATEVASTAARAEAKTGSEAGEAAANIETKAASAESKAASAEQNAASAESKTARPHEESAGPKAGEEPAGSKPKTEEPGAPKTREERVKQSGNKDNPSQHEIDDELKHIGDNPHIITTTGEPPRRTAKIGEHEWREGPDGKWCRYSETPTNCALPGAVPEGMRSPATPSGKPKGEGETPAGETKPKGEEPVAEAKPKPEETAAAEKKQATPASKEELPADAPPAAPVPAHPSPPPAATRSVEEIQREMAALEKIPNLGNKRIQRYVDLEAELDRALAAKYTPLPGETPAATSERLFGRQRGESLPDWRARLKAMEDEAARGATLARNDDLYLRDYQAATAEVEAQMAKPAKDLAAAKEAQAAARAESNAADAAVSRWRNGVTKAEERLSSAKRKLRDLQDQVNAGKIHPQSPDIAAARQEVTSAGAKVREMRGKLDEAREAADTAARKRLRADDAANKAERGARELPEAERKALRDGTPSAKTSDDFWAQRPGAVYDTAYPGNLIKERSIDHIVPTNDIMKMDNFNRLTTQQQKQILDLPENLVPMEKAVNSSRGDLSWHEWKGHSQMPEIDPAIRAKMAAKEDALRVKIQEMINKMAGQ